MSSANFWEGVDLPVAYFQNVKMQLTVTLLTF